MAMMPLYRYGAILDVVVVMVVLGLAEGAFVAMYVFITDQTLPPTSDLRQPTPSTLPTAL